MTSDPFKPDFLSRLHDEPKSTAIVCASRIGDFICATPAFRALKKRLPGSTFTLIGLPFVRALVERNPHLDEFEPFPGFPGIAEQFFEAPTALRFFGRMQQRRFDLAIQMHGSGVFSNIVSLMLGARYTAGFVRLGDEAGRLDAAMTWPATLHAARRALSLAVFLGAPPCGEHLEFELASHDREAADTLLRKCAHPLIGLHPGSAERGKIWPEERFAAAGAALRQKIGGTIVIIGGPREREAGERIALSVGGPVVNAAGREPLGEMGALIARLSILMTNDSGPAHIAYALATPTVTLFGATDPDEWGPPSRPYHRVLRSADHDLSSIHVQDAVEAANSALCPTVS